MTDRTMGEYENNSIRFASYGGVIALAFLCLCLALCSTGCSTTNNHLPQPVAESPSADWLVERSISPWLTEQEGYETLPTEEQFFVEPPEFPTLKELKTLSQIYGYDFPTLRTRAWEWLNAVEHIGQ